jgi:hypothetical protein
MEGRNVAAERGALLITAGGKEGLVMVLFFIFGRSPICLGRKAAQ